MGRRHYLDHASTSPTRPEAIAALVDELHQGGADPARLHQDGARARHAIEMAREQVAGMLGARPRSVIFTSGGTEAVAAAVHGATARGSSHIVGPAVEHSCVVKSSDRHDATWVPVDEFGRVGVDALLRAIGPQTALVHVQWGNHEVGTLQPVLEVVDACRNRDVLVHVDAAQAVGRVPIDFDALGADLLSVSGHKFGAPPGTGALVVRRGLRIDPLLVGGDQERARRAGFENAPAIAGFGAAAAAVSEVLLDEQSVATTQTERLAGAIEGWEGMHRIGHPTEHLPHIVCIGIDGVEPQAVLLGLDRAGISAHSGSACASEVIEPSPILAAMGLPADRSLRVSVGWTTTDDDIDAIIDEIPKIVNDLRRLAR